MEDRREEFEWYADWAADVSPLYERLARGAARTPALLAMCDGASPGQPAPQLLLAAVHALLLEGRDHPLAAFYPTCADDPIDPRDTDPFPVFRSFCLAYEEQIRKIMASRRVQTNAVGRSAVLLPAFAYVSRTAGGEPLALVELGASAGLNLYWDRYRYEYADRGVFGAADSSVTIETAVRGNRDPPLPERTPEVVHRVGNDLHPLDVTDEADAGWLRALVVPDQRVRHKRLAAAIDLVRNDPPELVIGDALDVVDDLVAAAPDDAALCLFSTFTLYQFEDDDIANLRRRLADLGRERPIHWLSGDPQAEGDHLTYRHVELIGGTPTETRLAESESYGAWIRWLAPR